MKKDGKYRYTLQFDDATEDHRLVGDFLERLGNRKSAVIIEAVRIYLDCHPELMEGHAKIQVQVEGTLNWSEIERKIRSMIEEKISSVQMNDVIEEQDNVSGIAENDLDEMLRNLDMFNL